MWALLTLYQLLRMAMTTAVETRPGTNPDRASFTSALQTARDQVTAAGICPDPDQPTDLLGVIGRAVLATLLPTRRARYSARKVKCATSRYLNRDDGRPAASTAVTGIEIRMHIPPPLDPTRRTRSRRAPGQPRAPRPPTRRDRVTALLVSDPRRAWSGAELAQALQIPKHNMLTQLAEWTRLGFITRTHAGSYALDPPPLADHSPARSRAVADPDGERNGARCSARSAARTNDLAPRRAASTLPAPREATRRPQPLPGPDHQTANSAALLRDAVHEAATATSLDVARPDGTTLTLRWGTQLDLREITPTVHDAVTDEHGEITDSRLAGYIAKYATKGTGKTDGHPDRPIRSLAHLERMRLATHHRRLIETAWHLGGLDQYAELNLRKWAHMLGFRGHFLTKSRAYSTTFRVIRGDRRAWRLAEQLTELGHPADDPVLVINDWHLVGIGHHTDTDRELAIAPRRTHPRTAHQQEDDMNERLGGVKDVAEYLGIPVQTIYQWRTKSYGPPGRRIGKHVRFVPEEVRAWVASLNKDVA